MDATSSCEDACGAARTQRWLREATAVDRCADESSPRQRVAMRAGDLQGRETARQQVDEAKIARDERGEP